MPDSPLSGKAPAPKAATPAPAVDFGYELATVSARVVGARRADVRAITDMASQFIDTFKRGPHLETSQVTMPFDVAAEDTLKGNIGSERAAAEDANFSVTVGRRLGK